MSVSNMPPYNGVCEVCKRNGSAHRIGGEYHYLCFDCFRKHSNAWAKTRQKRMGISGDKWKKRRLEVLERDDYTCQECGRKEGEPVEKTGYMGHRVWLVVDHIIPLAKGGSSELDNLQALCAECNTMKGAN